MKALPIKLYREEPSTIEADVRKRMKHASTSIVQKFEYVILYTMNPRVYVLMLATDYDSHRDDLFELDWSLERKFEVETSVRRRK